MPIARGGLLRCRNWAAGAGFAPAVIRARPSNRYARPPQIFPPQIDSAGADVARVQRPAGHDCTRTARCTSVPGSGGLHPRPSRTASSAWSGSDIPLRPPVTPTFRFTCKRLRKSVAAAMAAHAGRPRQAPQTPRLIAEPEPAYECRLSALFDSRIPFTAPMRSLHFFTTS